MILLVLFAAGCAVETTPSSRPSASPDAPTATFTQNTYYTGIVPPYATPEACEASEANPIECHLELGFCADGTAGFSNYDLPEQGTYYLAGSIVVASIGSGAPIRLDTQTGQATNSDVDTYILDTVGRWNTLQLDAGITCP